MLPRHPVAKAVFYGGAALTAVAVAAVCFLFWKFGITHRLTALELGQHRAQLKVNYHYDVSHDVLCELSGPQIQHPAEIIAYIGAADSVPRFTVHQAANRQVFWVTADTLPKTILYALDVETGKHWPPRASGKDGQEFLEVANGTERGYRLYEHEWIGAKK